MRLCVHVELVCFTVGFSQRCFRLVGFFLLFFPEGVGLAPLIFSIGPQLILVIFLLCDVGSLTAVARRACMHRRLSDVTSGWGMAAGRLHGVGAYSLVPAAS